MLTRDALGWADHLAQVRRQDADWSSRRYDLRPYWRAQAYRAHAGQPEPIVRAHALASVLDHLPLVLYPGDLIVGAPALCKSRDLPAGIFPEDYDRALREHGARGQRDFWAGFDHTLADYPTLLAAGIGGLIDRARRQLEPPRTPQEQAFLEAVVLSLEAFSRFILRHADACRIAGRTELADLLHHIALHPPRTLHEALQLVWLTDLAFITEGRAHMALGRIDQYLLPFFQRDLEAGTLTRAEAFELFCHLWTKVDQTGEVVNICIGGLTPGGEDAANELSYLCLEATAAVRSPYTNLSARFHEGSPERFHQACFECIRTGIGFPAIFNDHVLLPGLEEIGIPPDVARDYCMVGCIETMLAGRQPAWSDGRFNTPVYLLQALRRLDSGPQRSYDRLVELFQEEIRTGLTAYVRRYNEHLAQFPPARFPDPFLSALTRDCLARARDINDGGAEFPRFHGVCIMGLATLADSLAAVRKLVFEDRAIRLEELLKALEADFAGYEPMRQMLLHRAPKYGNNEPYVDDIAAWFVDFAAEECLRHKTYDGGRFVSAMAANVQNISAGKECGATPDGRQARTPLSDAASPHFGRDAHGPTSFLQSVARPDYHRVLTGSVINMKFEPEWFAGEDGIRRFSTFTHFFVKARIPELQFNFTGTRVLEAAQRHPEEYRNLVVRVSGFSAYFVGLSPEVQNDIVRRRAHR